MGYPRSSSLAFQVLEDGGQRTPPARLTAAIEFRLARGRIDPFVEAWVVRRLQVAQHPADSSHSSSGSRKSWRRFLRSLSTVILIATLRLANAL